MDAIGQLTGGIAHDFNNLLSAVLGGIHLLERRLQLGEREQLIVDQMRHAAEQGAELVRRMMAFARKQDLSPTSVDPRSLCKSVAGLVEHTLGRDDQHRLGMRRRGAEPVRRQVAARARAGQPHHQCARRHAAAAGRSTSASTFDPDAAIGTRIATRPLCPDPGQRSGRRHSRASWSTGSPSPSSPPRKPARAPASACRWSPASSSNRAAG